MIDPNQNPDGRERFIHGFTSALGLEPHGDRYAAEHDQPWPRGRFNHYVFDLNRDWFAMTQPETQGKVQALLDWHPVVFVDSHEMGGDRDLFLPAICRPVQSECDRCDSAPSKLNLARTWRVTSTGSALPISRVKIYDAFYPGYGDMWPTLNGAVANDV